MAIEYAYQCKHCKKPFNKERFFMAHECKEMQRAKEIQSPVGQQAYQLYKFWLEKQRRKAPPIETFITSTFYTSFIKFATFVRELKINNSEAFITLMNSKSISPALWTRSECYQEYIEFVDKKDDPLKQVEKTLDELIKLADKLGCELHEVFANLKHGEIMTMLNQHRLSPWLLFCSATFKAKLGSFEDHDRALIMKALGVDYWAHALEQKPDVVKEVKMIVAELGL